jgi:hypothetical protein
MANDHQRLEMRKCLDQRQQLELELERLELGLGQLVLGLVVRQDWWDRGCCCCNTHQWFHSIHNQSSKALDQHRCRLQYCHCRTILLRQALGLGLEREPQCKDKLVLVQLAQMERGLELEWLE